MYTPLMQCMHLVMYSSTIHVPFIEVMSSVRVWWNTFLLTMRNTSSSEYGVNIFSDSQQCTNILMLHSYKALDLASFITRHACLDALFLQGAGPDLQKTLQDKDEAFESVTALLDETLDQADAAIEKAKKALKQAEGAVPSHVSMSVEHQSQAV